jgi:hypothetical protein
MSNVLILRCSSPTGISHGGFRWPLEVGATVEAPDWDPKPDCGQGLHGWLWGEGDVGDSEYHSNPNAIWHLVDVPEKDVVGLGRKVKFPRGIIVAFGKRDEMVGILQADPRAAGRTLIGGTATAGDGGSATAGDYGTATAGDGGTATAGYRGTATAGYQGTATAGDKGLIMIRWFDPDARRCRIHTGYIGENGLKPNTPYKLDDKGNFIEAPTEQEPA